MRPVLRLSSPLARPFAGTRRMPIWALVEHRGRRSGRVYRTPVAIRPTARGVAVPIAYGTDADWTRNIFAAGRCAILWQDRRYDATDPMIVDAREGLATFSPMHRALLRMSGVEQVLLLTTADGA
jgi:deazaflavin-dependent oxidoreductase (nitroreductase family)